MHYSKYDQEDTEALTVSSFDDLGLKEELLRGIYGKRRKDFAVVFPTTAVLIKK